MPHHSANERIAAESLRQLIAKPAFADIAAYLGANAVQIDADLRDTVLQEIPAFSASRNPDILPDLAKHASQHTYEIRRLVAGESVGDFEFVRAHARRRAEQHFPLEATLHAYRCGHKVFSRWMRDAAVAAAECAGDAQAITAAVADFAIEYTDVVSTVVTSEYIAHTRLIAKVAGDQRTELLNILLDGHDESDGHVAKVLRAAGFLDSRQSFCVALAQSADPKEMLSPKRARRLADSISRTLADSFPRRLLDIRDNKVTIVVSIPRRVSGWSAPRSRLAQSVQAELALVGPAAIIGVSNDVPSTAHIPTAYREAQLALELASVADRIVQFSDIPLRRLAVHFAEDKIQGVLPRWAKDFERIDDKSNGALVTTLRTYANSNMNVLRTAENLNVHPNTVYARLERLHDATGLDARSYHALTELLIAADFRAGGRIPGSDN